MDNLLTAPVRGAARLLVWASRDDAERMRAGLWNAAGGNADLYHWAIWRAVQEREDYLAWERRTAPRIA
jgi:hypothetical protein